MNDAYISLEDAKKEILRWPDMTEDDKRVFYMRMSRLPASDVRQVVTCGECIYQNSGKQSCVARRPDWFCADGIRRLDA